MQKGKKNRIIVITGDGKGKTTSALGMVVRAVGHGLRACVIQFVKDRRDTGEVRALALLPGVELHVCGDGFVLPSDDGPACENHRRAAEAGLALARRKLADPSYGLIALDEICGAVALGLLGAATVCETITTASPGSVIVLTGRGAPPELVAVADTVSRIECVKHGYDAGCPAQPGVEF